MDAVLLARIQFALTAGFHFLFPPLSIGLAWLLVALLWRYKKTGDALDGQIARFWLRLFALSFAVGVASGIVLEFQFGTNWSRYSKFVGDIFGAPLAAEGVLAFFLESVFIGALLFGWSKLSRTMLWFSALMVAVGSTLSAFWIIVANSWMQTPVAFVLRNDRAELTNFFAAVFNPSTLPRYLHTVDAALITGAFFMLGISAWFVLHGRHLVAAKRTLTLALVVAFFAAVAELGLGHYHAVQVALTQPEKMAAFEGLFETRTQAPLLMFGMPDVAHQTVKYAVGIPGGLSWLVYFNPGAEVKGLNAFPREEWPPVALSFYPFHLMVALGMFFIGFTALGLLLWWRGMLFTSRLFLLAAWWSIPLPFLAANIGWMAAEMGRQPWIVYRLLKTADAVSVTVPAWQVLASIIMFTVLYAILLVAWLRFTRREIANGIEEPSPSPVAAGELSA